jgi:hypothetical protein
MASKKVVATFAQLFLFDATFAQLFLFDTARSCRH